MIQISRIGLAIAFSPTASAMLAEASHLVRHFHAQLILIHVGIRGGEEERRIYEMIGQTELVTSEVLIVWKKGEPVKEILKACKEEKIDLLLVGALKKENLVNHYLGTVARKIVHKADCSVLMITNPTLESRPLKNIVVNAEDSPFVEPAIYAACHWSLPAPDVWIHIVRELKLLGLALSANAQRTEEEYLQSKQNMLAEEKKIVEKILQRIPHDNLKINIKMLSGKSGFELARFAERKKADLLILGAPRRKFSFFSRLFPHDQEYIFNELPCNVLVVNPRKIS
ncbi:MAG: universal stress protein [Cyclobacteriaceae bacterium]|nr:universal stress protein [Cyclobacteriaceae bacterium]